MTTAGDIINGSLRLLGILAEGETPSAETSQDALNAMNQMIDSWNTERLSVFSTQDQVETWPPSTRSRTFGPTGDIVGNRPILIDDSTYFKDPATGISYGLKLINQQQYKMSANCSLYCSNNVFIFTPVSLLKCGFFVAHTDNVPHLFIFLY